MVPLVYTTSQFHEELQLYQLLGALFHYGKTWRVVQLTTEMFFFYSFRSTNRCVLVIYFELVNGAIFAILMLEQHMKHLALIGFHSLTGCDGTSKFFWQIQTFVLENIHEKLS